MAVLIVRRWKAKRNWPNPEESTDYAEGNPQITQKYCYLCYLCNLCNLWMLLYCFGRVNAASSGNLSFQLGQRID